jgi:hypothetical protein
MVISEWKKEEAMTRPTIHQSLVTIHQRELSLR